MPGTRKTAKDNTAAVAAEFGISPKALRLYERLGMLAPARNGAGWRVYGSSDVARLRTIVSLKRLDLPLSRIAELFKNGAADISALLWVQERLLTQSRIEIDNALKLIAIARQRLEKNRTLSAEELAALVERISRTVIQWTPELDDLAKQIYTPQQLERVRAGSTDPKSATQLSADWESLIAQMNGLPQDCAPQAPEALALGRKLVAMFRRQAGDDKDFWNNSARFWREAISDQSIAPGLQMNITSYEFFGAIFAELQRLGELKF